MEDRQRNADPGEARIIYDGGCPVCRTYVRFTEFENDRPLTYIDARQSLDLVSQLSKQGIELDEGLVVAVDDELHHGADAMHVLAGMTRRRGIWNRAVAWPFSTRRSSRILYPVFRAGRNLLLRMLRRPPLKEHR
jgi:predicted DCC family thiol-disulfide oxidoreductase YuxK